MSRVQVGWGGGVYDLGSQQLVRSKFSNVVRSADYLDKLKDQVFSVTDSEMTTAGFIGLKLKDSRHQQKKNYWMEINVETSQKLIETMP